MSDDNTPATTDANTATSDATQTTTTDANAAVRTHDYEARLRTGGDFAVNEAKSQQSRADRAEGQVRDLSKRIGKLETYLDNGLDGDALAGHLETYNNVLQHPQLGDVIRGFINTGKVPSMAGRSEPTDLDNDDELLTTEEKEIRNLRAELNELRGQIVEHGSSLGQQAFTKHLDAVASELHLEPKDIEAVSKKLEGNISKWASQGDTGRAAIRNLQSAEGASTVRMLAVDALGMPRLRELVRTELLRENQIRDDIETDGPSGSHSNVGESMVPEQASALEALQAFRAHPEWTERTRA